MDQKLGIEIVERAILAPLKAIASNAGHEGAVVAGECLKSDDPKYGFNAQTGEYVDLIATGIIDPAKVRFRAAARNSLLKKKIYCGFSVQMVDDQSTLSEFSLMIYNPTNYCFSANLGRAHGHRRFVERCLSHDDR